VGRCSYCGEDAGFFRSSHRECEVKYDNGWGRMVTLALEAAQGTPDNFEDLVPKLGAIAESSYIRPNQIREALTEGWEEAVSAFLDDHVISEDEESHLKLYMERFSLSQADLDHDGSYTSLVKGGVIREILDGKVPSRVSVEGTLPFNFQKSESLVWAFQNVPYYELRVRRERKGSYGGFSVRVMKGVYYHTGGFKNQPVERLKNEHSDTGLVGITTKHIYFSGPKKKFRVPYSKIVAIDPYSDGIGIMRDAASARPQSFITGDGWFTYNLVVNLSQL
jgi:hypothetical protein